METSAPNKIKIILKLTGQRSAQKPVPNVLDGDVCNRETSSAPFKKRKFRTLVAPPPKSPDEHKKHANEVPLVKSAKRSRKPRLEDEVGLPREDGIRTVTGPTGTGNPAYPPKRKRGSKGAAPRASKVLAAASEKGQEFVPKPRGDVPTKKSLEAILDRLQKKDTYGAFSKPVDRKEVPDYYDIIQRPMDYGTMRVNCAKGLYGSWDLFEEHCRLICDNGMLYNDPQTKYYKQAKAMKDALPRQVELAKKGALGGAAVGATGGVGKAGGKWSAGVKPGAAAVGRPPGTGKGKRLSTDAEVSDDAQDEDLGGRRGVGQVHSPDEAGGGRRDNGGRKGSGGVGSSAKSVRLENPSKVGGAYRSGQTPGKTALSLGEPPPVFRPPRLPLSQKVDLSRRWSYRSKIVGSEKDELVFSCCPGAGGKPVIKIANSSDSAYAQSLVLFAGGLGPLGWKIAAENIRKSCKPGTKIERGWVGAPRAPVALASSPLPAPAKKDDGAEVLLPMNHFVEAKAVDQFRLDDVLNSHIAVTEPGSVARPKLSYSMASRPANHTPSPPQALSFSNTWNQTKPLTKLQASPNPLPPMTDGESKPRNNLHPFHSQPSAHSPHAAAGNASWNSLPRGGAGSVSGLANFDSNGVRGGSEFMNLGLGVGKGLETGSRGGGGSVGIQADINWGGTQSQEGGLRSLSGGNGSLQTNVLYQQLQNQRAQAEQRSRLAAYQQNLIAEQSLKLGNGKQQFMSNLEQQQRQRHVASAATQQQGEGNHPLPPFPTRFQQPSTAMLSQARMSTGGSGGGGQSGGMANGMMRPQHQQGVGTQMQQQQQQQQQQGQQQQQRGGGGDFSTCRTVQHLVVPSTNQSSKQQNDILAQQISQHQMRGQMMMQRQMSGDQQMQSERQMSMLSQLPAQHLQQPGHHLQLSRPQAAGMMSGFMGLSAHTNGQGEGRWSQSNQSKPESVQQPSQGALNRRFFEANRKTNVNLESSQGGPGEGEETLNLFL